MNIVNQINKYPTLRLPFGRMAERPAAPAASTLSSSELKRIVEAMLG